MAQVLIPWYGVSCVEWSEVLYIPFIADVRKPISLRSNEDDMVVVMDGDMGADGRRDG